MKPLVSILISAYNAEEWIGYTLQSAVAQTWPRKKIIVVDDGSTDGTAELGAEIRLERGHGCLYEERWPFDGPELAYRHSQGDYIQFLDADDLLAPDRLSGNSPPSRHLIARGYFSLRRGLRSTIGRGMPVLFVTRFAGPYSCGMAPEKNGENIHMQNATWLVSRELAELGALKQPSLQYDKIAEYFARRAFGVRPYPVSCLEQEFYYRLQRLSSISYIGNSDKKKESLLRSMKFHIRFPLLT